MNNVLMLNTTIERDERMTKPATSSDQTLNSVTRTKYLHVEIPEELFRQAKIQALQSEMTWTEYICSLLIAATNPSRKNTEKAPEQ